MLIIYIILSIAFLALSLKKPIYGVASIIVMLPGYLWRFEFFSLPTTFLELMIIVLFFIFLLKDKNYQRLNFSLKKSAENRLTKNLRYLLSAWLLISLLAFLVNPTLSALGLWRAYFLEPMIFFLILIYSIKDVKDIKIIINSLAILVLWLLVVTIYQNFSSWNYLLAYQAPNVKRLTGVFSYPNALSLLTAPLAGFFATYFIYLKNEKNRWLYFLPALSAIIMSFLTVSQGAISAIIISLIFYLILAKKIRRFTLPVLIIIFVASFIFLPIGQKTKQVSQELFRPDLNLSASSLEIRSSQWQENWLMLKDNIIFGAGLNGYQKEMEKYHQSDWLEIYLYPHNFFLNFWSETGLLGLIAILLILIKFFTDYLRTDQARRPLYLILISVMIAIVVHGLVDVQYFKNDLSVLFWLVVGMSVVVKGEGQRAEVKGQKQGQK